MIVHLHAILGNRWSAIASHLPRRTDNEIKNYWNTHLRKRLLQMGIDPVTHKSTTAEELILDNILPGLKPVVSSNLSHMSQWEIARAEAEARLSRQSSLNSSSNLQHSHQDFNLNTKTTPYQGASTNFMSTWKARVAETLRPDFGTVELDKVPANPVNLQAFFQDWESLQAPQVLAKPFSEYNCIDCPDLSSGAASEVVSPQYSCEGSQCTMPGSSTIFPTPAQINERQFVSQCDFFSSPRIDLKSRLSIGPSTMFPLSRMNSNSDSQSLSAADSNLNYSGACADTDNQFSPTSTLHAPDHDSSYTNSPCGSSNSGSECFDLLEQTFPLVNQNNIIKPSRSNIVFPSGQTFWSRQQVAMMDGFQLDSYFLPELELASLKPQSFNVGSTAPILHQVEVPNDISISHF